MTGYTVHTGSNEKFTSGWDRVFRSVGPKKAANPATARKGKTKSAGKKRSKG
jgi:hypothetical protein